jgi:hypothetical protein
MGIQVPNDSKEEPKYPQLPCEDRYCPGWGIFNDKEVQRCDTCERYPDDETAGIAATRWLQHAKKMVSVAREFAEYGDEEDDWDWDPLEEFHREFWEVIDKLDGVERKRRGYCEENA